MDLKSNAATVANKQHPELPFQNQNNPKGNQFHKHSGMSPFIAFVFLTYNAAISVYGSRGNLWYLAFVLSCYAKLAMHFWCLKMRQNLGADAPLQHMLRLKIAVWILTTLVTVTFAYKVSPLMPLCLKIVVWAMSGSVILAGFYAFFILDKDVKGANGYCKLDCVHGEERKMNFITCTQPLRKKF
jgi:Family of unknown function (DUF6490)